MELKVCNTENCENKVKAKSLCNKHYRQQPYIKNREQEYEKKYKQSGKRSEAVRKWGKGPKGKKAVKDYQTSFKARFNFGKNRAKKKNLEWSLDFLTYEHLISDNTCHYCLAGLGKYGVGLDRMDNTKGYIIENVVPCCSQCNKFKNDLLTHTEMIVIVDLLKKWRGEKVW